MNKKDQMKPKRKHGYEEGQEILVSSDNSEWVPRIYLHDGAYGHVICLCYWHRNAWEKGEVYKTLAWRYHKPISDKRWRPYETFEEVRTAYKRTVISKTDKDTAEIIRVFLDREAIWSVSVLVKSARSLCSKITPSKTIPLVGWRNK